MKYEIPIAPMGKPRMVRSDRWKKRPVVTRYWSFKDELVDLCRKAGYVQGMTMYVKFLLPMPKSWSKKKRAEMDGRFHDQKFDTDNLIKSLGDCLLPEGDEKIHTICASKVWSSNHGIIFFDTIEEWILDFSVTKW